jgi:anaerobic magnesium-protoporphyrin IX monomethyl ester cyclase
MKVLLISQSDKYRKLPDFPPLGIGYLGAAAHKAGHRVQLIDGSLHSINQIVAEAKKIEPDVIGITCWTIDRSMVWKLCDSLKKVLSATFLVIGGPHASIYPEHILKKTHASAVVLGEGEETFVELLNALNNNVDLKNVPGIALRSKDDSPLFTQQRNLIENISSIPFPYYDGFKNFSFLNYGGLPALPRPTAAIISSRGCIFNCSYCASVCYWGRKWRFRSTEDVLAEIKWLIEKYAINSLFFFDDNFAVDEERVKAICKGIIENKWDLKWGCCAHIKMIKSDLLGIMKESGCVTIDFGVESGSDKILTNINKKQTRKDIINTFLLVHKAGISPQAYLMVGCPGEDEATIDETIELMDIIKPRSSIGANILWLLPGTKVYKEAVEKGIISDSYWLDSDEIGYNTMEQPIKKLKKLRKRLLKGMAKQRGGIKSWTTYYLKEIYYEYPFLSMFRSFFRKRYR